MSKKIAQLAATAVLAVGLGTAASAQEYPFRDITTAVVWGAGGGTDSRLFAFNPIGFFQCHQSNRRCRWLEWHGLCSEPTRRRLHTRGSF